MNEQPEGRVYCRRLTGRTYHVFSWKVLAYDSYESDPCPICIDMESTCSK